ncbi:hypothetical protein QUF54_07510 [Candidatus Marithioploca araucensis]|uniref:Lipoprotein n=1 Tax=Candidatus Marithioploca araucensis TaxID=70273 RepID=A0ABT7VUD0_9GAMM|nr:hypothetical protein [Candidatus Marithioploca araucensis]
MKSFEKWIIKKKKWTILMALGVLGILFFGCSCTDGDSNGPLEVHAVNDSVAELVSRLPNLKPLNIVECEFVLTRHNSSRSIIPSPSDVSLKLVGQVTLNEAGWKDIRSRYEWKFISRDVIPEDLNAYLPVGAVLVSYKLNESFSNNPTFAHGFVVISNAVENQIYLLATDIDHPIR